MQIRVTKQSIEVLRVRASRLATLEQQADANTIIDQIDVLFSKAERYERIAQQHNWNIQELMKREDSKGGGFGHHDMKSYFRKYEACVSDLRTVTSTMGTLVRLLFDLYGQSMIERRVHSLVFDTGVRTSDATGSSAVALNLGGAL